MLVLGVSMWEAPPLIPQAKSSECELRWLLWFSLPRLHIPCFLRSRSDVNYLHVNCSTSAFGEDKVNTGSQAVVAESCTAKEMQASSHPENSGVTLTATPARGPHSCAGLL
jgi:hypothetical protein